MGLLVSRMDWVDGDGRMGWGECVMLGEGEGSLPQPKGMLAMCQRRTSECGLCVSLREALSSVERCAFETQHGCESRREMKAISYTLRYGIPYHLGGSNTAPHYVSSIANLTGPDSWVDRYEELAKHCIICVPQLGQERQDSRALRCQRASCQCDIALIQ